MSLQLPNSINQLQAKERQAEQLRQMRLGLSAQMMQGLIPYLLEDSEDGFEIREDKTKALKYFADLSTLAADALLTRHRYPIAMSQEEMEERKREAEKNGT